jgi:hypothetical protein
MITMKTPRICIKDRDGIEDVKMSHNAFDKQGRDIGRQYQISHVTLRKSDGISSPKLFQDVSPTFEEIKYGKKFVEVISRMTKDGEVWGSSHRVDTFRSKEAAYAFIESHFSKAQKKQD